MNHRGGTVAALLDRWENLELPTGHRDRVWPDINHA